MADSLTPERRSWNMSQIKSKDTKPEIYLRKLLFSKGYRYRIAPNYILGHPDIFLKKYNTAIFVHGCYWHRHIGCRYAYTPKSNVDFWFRKFDENVQRDKRVSSALSSQGIKSLIIWECTIKNMQKSEEMISLFAREFESFLLDDSMYKEF